MYIYNYNDHLDKWKQSESFFEICERSSVRLSYADSNKNGAIEASTEIIEETEVTRLADSKKNIKMGEAKQLLSFWIEAWGV